MFIYKQAWKVLTAIYILEIFAVAIAISGALDKVEDVKIFVGHMASQFGFVRAHMRLSKYPELISGLYWSLAIIFWPVKSILLLVAPYNPAFIGKEKRKELSQASNGSFYGMIKYVALRGLQKWTLFWRVLVTFGVITLLLGATFITFFHFEAADLASTSPTNWPHAKVIVFEYFFNLSPITLLMAGSGFTFFQSAFLVGAVATISAFVQITYKNDPTNLQYFLLSVCMAVGAIMIWRFLLLFF